MTTMSVTSVFRAVVIRGIFPNLMPLFNYCLTYFKTSGRERRKWFKYYLFNLLTFLCPFGNSLFKVHRDLDTQNNPSVSLSKLNFTTCNLDFSEISNHRGLKTLAQIYNEMKKIGRCPECVMALTAEWHSLSKAATVILPLNSFPRNLTSCKQITFIDNVGTALNNSELYQPSY